jgi:hypothetical protein
MILSTRFNEIGRSGVGERFSITPFERSREVLGFLERRNVGSAASLLMFWFDVAAILALVLIGESRV